MDFFRRHLEDEAATHRLGAEIALWLRCHDFVCLEGELGAGKTALARATLRSLSGDSGLDVPSPTFTLVQTYENQRLKVAHVDLYRIADAAEAEELGLDDAAESGAVLIEWPSRLSGNLPADRLEIVLTMAQDGGRDVAIVGHGAWRKRLDRQAVITRFIRHKDWQDAARLFLKGDASTRSYERLIRHLANTPDTGNAPARAVLMNWPAVDETVVRDGLTYRQIARLAGNVTPFIAVGEHLRRLGLSAPQLYAADGTDGLLLLEDLGDESYGQHLRDGGDMDAPYEAAVAALARIHAEPPVPTLPLPDGRAYTLPSYDIEICLVETELLLDWAWPAIHGARPPTDAVDSFRAIWDELFASVSHVRTLMLRDFHSPNLIWLPERQGAARAGIIDHQDALLGHPAYDLVSLGQDARVDISEAREAMIFETYLRQMPDTLGLGEAEFRRAYAILGAQRATRLLGLFTRLLHRDGKPEYLRHMPRVAAYLRRNLTHPALAPLKSWIEIHFGQDYATAFRKIGPTP